MRPNYLVSDRINVKVMKRAGRDTIAIAIMEYIFVSFFRVRPIRPKIRVIGVNEHQPSAVMLLS